MGVYMIYIYIYIDGADFGLTRRVEQDCTVTRPKTRLALHTQSIHRGNKGGESEKGRGLHRF